MSFLHSMPYWDQLIDELDEHLGRRKARRVAEQLMKEIPSVETLPGEPVRELFESRIAAKRAHTAQLEQELETRVELHDYFLGQLDYQISLTAQSLGELAGFGTGYNTGVDVKRNLLERQLTQLRKDRRDVELKTWDDMIRLRRDLRDAQSEYRELLRRYGLFKGDVNEGR